MAEATPRPMLQQTSVQAPPILAGSRVAVTVAPSDFTLSIGVGRPVFGADGQSVANTVEYHAGYSLSPTTAKQLAAILNLTLAKYEESYGVIPMDSAQSRKMAELAKRPLAKIGTPPTAKKGTAVRAKKVTTVRAKKASKAR